MWGGFIVVLLFISQCFGTDNLVFNITVDWNNVIYISKTSTTLQALNNLQADYVRFVPWLPYPRYAVAELEAPDGNPQCGSAATGQWLYFGCDQGYISEVTYASYGVQVGTCGDWKTDGCSAPGAIHIVNKYCIDNNNCSIPVSDDLFGDPCIGQEKRLAVEVMCSYTTNTTFWDFTLLDPVMEDIMNATKNHTVIINYSTIPQWMWNTEYPIEYPDDPNLAFWGYEKGNDTRDPTFQQIGDYYERLISWYTKGGFIDEYGVEHESGYYYDIPYWEILNEIDSEHAMEPQTYTAIYDAIVTSILKVQPNMKFVGLALAFRSQEYIAYFLNKSNHINEDIPIDFISYHFYAHAADRQNVTEYQAFFPLADAFFEEVRNISKIRDNLSPLTKTTLDELGTALPGDFDTVPLPIPDIYWNAAGSTYAYIFGNLILQGIDVMGESQLVAYPTQFPSVTMMDWETAKPNARYWVLYLLHSNFEMGDKLVRTTVLDSDYVYAQGFITPSGKKILVINKTMQEVQVDIDGIEDAAWTYVDPTTFEDPPATIQPINSTVLTLAPFATGIVLL